MRLQNLIILLSVLFISSAFAEEDAKSTSSSLPSAPATAKEGSCSLGPDHLYHKITAADGCPAQVIPLAAALKNSECPKRNGDEQKAIEAAQSKYETFLNGDMLKAADTYLNKPFPDAPGEAITRNGKTINRPNHGLAQGARTAALARDVAQSVLNSPKDSDFKTWLHEKMDNDADFMKKLSFAALFHRAGRTDESDSFGSDKRAKEGAFAAGAFQKMVSKAGLCFAPDEIEDFKKAIQLDGQRNSNVDQSNLSRLLRAGHVLDLVRVGYDVAADFRNRTPELSDADRDRLFKRAHGYLDATGAGSGYSEKFFDLSSNPDDLAKAIIDKSNSK